MAKRSFTIQLGSQQITEALLAYARGLVSASDYDVMVKPVNETRADAVYTQKRAPRKAKLKAAA